MPSLGLGGATVTTNLLPLYLTSSSGSPITSPTFASGELLVRLDSAAAIAASGVMHEVGGAGNGRGAFAYAMTDVEFAAKTITLFVEKTGIELYSFTTRLPFEPDFFAADTDVDRRRVVVYVEDPSTGLGVAGLALADTDLAVSVNYGAWTDAVGTWTAIASAPDGFYTYVLASSEVATPGLVLVLVTHASTIDCVPFMLSTYVADALPLSPSVPVPVTTPVVYGDPTYIDHVRSALEHLPQQFQGSLDV